MDVDVKEKYFASSGDCDVDSVNFFLIINLYESKNHFKFKA